MAEPERRYGPAGGLTLGGIIVIVGVVLMIVWSFWIGLIIALVGLIAFGGFARGRWYWRACRSLSRATEPRHCLVGPWGGDAPRGRLRMERAGLEPATSWVRSKTHGF